MAMLDMPPCPTCGAETMPGAKETVIGSEKDVELFYCPACMKNWNKADFDKAHKERKEEQLKKLDPATARAVALIEKAVKEGGVYDEGEIINWPDVEKDVEGLTFMVYKEAMASNIQGAKICVRVAYLQGLAYARAHPE